MMKKLFFILPSLFIPLIFFSCRFIIEEKKDFSLPGLESFPSEKLFWKIQIKGPEREETFFIEDSDFIKDGKFSIALSSSELTSLLAYPLFSYDGEPFFKPAGCIYPYQSELDFLSGFAAFMLREFYCHSEKSGNSGGKILDYSGIYNWEKLIEGLKKEEEKTDNYNPYFLDLTELLESFERESFSLSLLKMPKLKKFSINKLRESLQFEELLFSSYFPENRLLFNEGYFNYRLDKERIFMCPEERKFIYIKINSSGVVSKGENALYYK